MKRETHSKICIGILVGLFVILFIVSFSDWFSQVPYSVQFKVHGYTKENALAVCGGKDLEKTSFCLNSFTKGIYKYNPTLETKTLSFNELKEFGGDCRNYADLYLELFNKLGFKTQIMNIYVSREDNVLHEHEFLIAYDETGWCSLDQKHRDCFMYKK